jgi:hypothetical protein
MIACAINAGDTPAARRERQIESAGVVPPVWASAVLNEMQSSADFMLYRTFTHLSSERPRQSLL